MKLNKIMMAGLALCAGLAFTSCQAPELDPNPMAGTDVKLVSFGPSQLVRLDTMQIFGVKLDQVSKVIFPAAEVEKAAFVSQSAELIDVVIPDEARPGKIALLAGKDTIWSKSPLTFSEPISVESITPAEKIMPGTEITVKGDYVYNIASVEFQVGQVVKAADFVKCERRELVVKVPMGAVSGDVTFTDGADWVEKKALDILAASYTSMSADSLDFGQELTITGENFNLVEKVSFPGVANVDFVIAADGKSIKVNVPEDAAPGALTLTQYSLVALTTDTLKLPVISVSDVTPKADLQAGMTITVTGNLLNRVKSITTGGNKIVTDFTVNEDGTQITFVAPEGMSDGKIVLTQNANLSAETALVKMRKTGNLFYTVADGGFYLADDWSTWFQVAYNNEIQQLWRETITEPGKLSVNVELHEGADYYQVQWQQVLAEWSYIGQVDLAEGQTTAMFEVTQEIVDQIQTGNGIVFGGHGVTIVSFEWESSAAPKTLWEGDAEVNWNDGLVCAVPADVMEECTLGKTLYISYTVQEAEYHAIRMISAWWTFNPENNDAYNIAPTEDGVWEKTIDQDFLDKIPAAEGFNFTGFGCHITKVAIK